MSAGTSRRVLRLVFTKISLTLCAAALSVLMYPKFNLSFLAWVSLVPFLLAVENVGALPSFLLGFLFGLVTGSAVGHSVYFMVAEYEIPHYWGLFFTVVFVGGYIGFFFGAFAAMYSYARRHLPRPGLMYVVAPLMWVTCELGRGILFGGLPWELLGHSQYRFLSLIQISRWTGVYGVSFLIVLANYSLARLLIVLFARGECRGDSRVAPKKRKGETPQNFRNDPLMRSESGVPAGRAFGGLIVAAVMVLLSCAYGAYILSRPTDRGKVSQVAVVQGNIPRSEKWKPEFIDRNMNTYLELTEEALASNAKLIVWPETVLGAFFLQDDNKYLPRMRVMDMRNGAEMLVGGHHYIGEARSFRFYNTAFLVTAEQGIKQTYHKVALLPFAEYVPKWSFDFLKKRLRFPRDVSVGNEYTVFDSATGKFSVPICFEVVFSNHARKFVKNGAQFLINISNDAWYSESALSYQQVSMACFTAVENNVWVVRCDNNGLSWFISPTGAVAELIPFNSFSTV